MLNFNFCKFTKPAGCDDETFAFQAAGFDCDELTSDVPQAELNWSIGRASLTQKGETQQGIRLRRAGGTTCDKSPGQLMSVTIDVWCDPDAKDEPE